MSIRTATRLSCASIGARSWREARYVANPDGRSCELGIVVADDWHHTGIAQRLMGALIDAARARDFWTLEKRR